MGFTHTGPAPWKRDLAPEIQTMGKSTPLLSFIAHQTAAMQTLRLLQEKKGVCPGEGPGVPAVGRQGSHSPGVIEDGDSTRDTARDGDHPSHCAPCSGPRPQCPEVTQISQGLQSHFHPGGKKSFTNGHNTVQPAKCVGGNPAPVTRTLVEIASNSKLSRVADLTSKLLSVELNILYPLVENQPFNIPLKDSIEFRNICSHMALLLGGQHFDRDLAAAHHCLKTIVTKLLESLATFPPETHDAARTALTEILRKIPDV